jgi:hypothetical protein
MVRRCECNADRLRLLMVGKLRRTGEIPGIMPNIMKGSTNNFMDYSRTRNMFWKFQWIKIQTMKF